MGAMDVAPAMAAVPAPSPEEEERMSKIKAGFKVNWMNMVDCGSNQVMWESPQWDAFGMDMTANIPKEILQCRIVAREINFSSAEMMHEFKLIQKVYFRD